MLCLVCYCIVNACVKSEYDVICEEKQLPQKLNALDQLLCEQPKLEDGTRWYVWCMVCCAYVLLGNFCLRSPPAPPIPPTAALQERLLSLKIEERNRLRQVVAGLEKEHTTIAKQVAHLETEASQVATDITHIADITPISTASQNALLQKQSTHVN
jgi:hypothetical protein